MFSEYVLFGSNIPDDGDGIGLLSSDDLPVALVIFDSIDDEDEICSVDDADLSELALVDFSFNLVAAAC